MVNPKHANRVWPKSGRKTAPPYRDPKWRYKKAGLVTLHSLMRLRGLYVEDSPKDKRTLGRLQKADTQAHVFDPPYKKEIMELFKDLLQKRLVRKKDLKSKKIPNGTDDKTTSVTRTLDRWYRDRTFPKFMDLPAELRNHIYSYYFEAIKPVVSSFTRPAPPPLAQTCKLVREECMSLFWKTQTFHLVCTLKGGGGACALSSTDRAWLKEIVRKNLKWLRSFIISYAGRVGGQPFPVVQVDFDAKLIKAQVKHLGCWTFNDDAVYGVAKVPGLEPTQIGQELLRQSVDMMVDDRGANMDMCQLQLMLERVTRGLGG